VPEVFNHAQSACVAAILFRLFKSAEGSQRIDARFAGTHAAGDVQLYLTFEVIAQLGVQLAFEAILKQQRTEPLF
jgi:hypothetical protein